MKNGWFMRGGLIGLVVAVLVFPGCGKKGDPIPFPVQVKSTQQRIADLSVASIPEGMLLRWSMPGTDTKTDGFRIFRSETAAAEACPGCPQDYRLLIMLQGGDQRLVRDGATGGFRYVDMTVKEDHFYSYQVSACDPRGQCVEPSKPAQQIREKR